MFTTILPIVASVLAQVPNPGADFNAPGAGVVTDIIGWFKAWTLLGSIIVGLVGAIAVGGGRAMGNSTVQGGAMGAIATAMKTAGVIALIVPVVNATFALASR